ncbi:hypothetical protein FB45DRAFT_317732 [Roridomyces roridus]|uniref:F-box domain-containing protein n=1 Tax=Roridomyces roridus TaxID=1738132 RepID=A0AAD7B770_9AGAR|nr:hypothetical protein FB45DRAFT_317732 [Roridomyces roridus]
MANSIASSSPSPIGRLPTELLLEIFATCWGPFAEMLLDAHPTLSFREELEHLAHLPLLNLAQTCSEWHGIIMSAPLLWSDIRLVNAIWSIPAELPKVAHLLELALARSNGSPLSVVLSDLEPQPSHFPILQLLTASSEQWKALDVCYDNALSDAFKSVRGRLPQLETLLIEYWGGESDLSALDCFSSVPELTTIEFYGSTRGLRTFPLAQLHTVTYLTVSMSQARDIGAVMSPLRNDACFSLELFLSQEDVAQISNLWLSPSRSNIGLLHIDLDLDKDIHPTVFDFERTVGAMFDSMTLPLLETLEVYVHFKDKILAIGEKLHWPCEQFLALSQRSSFDAHLCSLDIADVVITEAELIECLKALPSLEHLSIADHRPEGVEVGGIGYNHLITDSLLAHLVILNGPDYFTHAPLVPWLRSFVARTMLQFTDLLYFAFVCTRVSDDLLEGEYFESVLLSLDDPPRELDRGVNAARVEELCAAGKLRLEVGLAEVDADDS